MSTSIVEKIAKVLNQAENAGTEAEAAAFMNKAQQLATAYSVDLAKARFMTVAKERTVPIIRTVELGERKTKGLNTFVALITGIAGANDVRLTIRHDSTAVHLYGFEEDIQVVEALFASLAMQMATAAAAYRKTGDWKQDTVRRASYTVEEDYYGRKRRYFAGYEEKPVSWISARLDFQEAFAVRVGNRLYMARLDAQKDIVEADVADDSAGTELVLVKKREAVADFYKANNNARGTYRGGRNTVASHAARSAGNRAGDSARLTNAASLPGARRAVSA